MISDDSEITLDMDGTPKQPDEVVEEEFLTPGKIIVE